MYYQKRQSKISITKNSIFEKGNISNGRAYKGEQTDGHVLRELEKDAYSQIHERLREIYHALAGIVDGHGGDGKVRVLYGNTTHYIFTQ